jgi:hypothetical protein
MNAIALSRCLDDVIEAIEYNQDSCKALTLARDRAFEVVAACDIKLLERHGEYDALVEVKESLLRVNGMTKL